ncbi:MAG: hypothetical protein JKY62_15990 [Desulfocapsa sp.]|nr:hypothetical protein [Desulfocapsa sp.]
MLEIQIIQKQYKIFIGLCTSVLVLFSMAVSCVAADYVAIKIYPEHVGVFTTVNKQQYVAYGVTADSSLINITRNVDWVSSDESIVTIDDNGLASVVAGKTSGIIKVTCTYPKTGPTGTAVNLLLL